MATGQSNKVSEVFMAAGQAFNKLAELTMEMHSHYESIPHSKWTDEEIEMLRNAVKKFGNDLVKVTEVVKTRTINQVKHAIKRRVYTDAGMSAYVKKQVQPNKETTSYTSSITNTPTAKRQKVSNFTANAVTDVPSQKNTFGTTSANDSIVDVENLDETSANSLKKLDQLLQSTKPNASQFSVSESVVSNPSPLPPLDLVTQE